MEQAKPRTKRSVPKLYTGTEAQQLLIAWLVLGFSFSIGELFHPALFMKTFVISLITVGLGFLGHELAHKFTAQRYGCFAEFRLWTWGLAMALMLAIVSGGRMIFAAPGAVYIMPRRTWEFGQATSRRQNGLISLAGPMVNYALALIFLLASSVTFLSEVGAAGYRINLWLGAFNLLPFGQLDGFKVFNWSKAAWAVFTIPILVLLFLPIHF